MRCIKLISIAAIGLTTCYSVGQETSVGLENMAQLLRGDVRLIAMGDSYSAPFYTRIPLASLRVWPIPNIMAMGSGASDIIHTITCMAQCTPVSAIISSDGFGYTIERNSR